MATFYCDSTASAGGNGLSNAPWNTFASITWNSLSSGDVLNFSGSFSETLLVGSDNIILDGKNTGVVTIIDANGLNVGIDCDGRVGVEIRGFNVKNASLTNIEVSGSLNCHVHSCAATNSGFDDLRLKHSTDCSIKYCVSIDAIRRAITLSTANVGSGMSGCEIEYCSAFGAGLRGYTLSGDPTLELVTSSSIKNSLAQNCLEGLQVNYAGSDCVLENLKLIDNVDTGIYEVSNVSDTTFTDIEIVGGTAASINNIQNVTDVTFDGITTRAATGSGFRFVANTNVTRVTIKNCQITGASNNAAYGIYTDSTSTIDTLIVNNNLFSGNDLMMRIDSNWINSSITNNTFSFTGVTGSTRDALSIRVDQTNELIISKNVFEGVEGQCIDETSAFAHNLTTSENFYSGLQVGNLVKVNGQAYSETSITTFEPTRILYRQDAFGFMPVVASVSTNNPALATNAWLLATLPSQALKNLL